MRQASNDSTVTLATSATVAAPSNAPTRKSGDWLKIGEVSRRYGIHAQTVRRLCDSGELKTAVLPSGHRLVSQASCLDYFEGLSPEDNAGNGGGAIPVALIARVSGNRQAKGLKKGEDSDFTRQQQRVREAAETRWGNSAVYHEYYRVASGMHFGHPVFVKLCSDILEGRFRGGYIVCERKDRLVRFGSEMFLMLCERGGCELVILNPAEDETADLAEDIIACCTHFSAKQHGRRAAQTCTKSLDEEVVRLAIALRKQRYYVSDITRILNERGYVDSHGEEISEYLVKKYLDSNGVEEALTYVVTGSYHQPSFELFREFVEGHIRTTGNPKDRLKVSVDIMPRYREFCESRGVVAESANDCGKQLTAMGFERRMLNGCLMVCGVVMV